VYGSKNRDSITHYEVAKSFSLAEIVNLKLETGRTHQIRVHLSYYGHPVIGDSTYGGRSKAIKNFRGIDKQIGLSLLQTLDSQALHAYMLNFAHPVTNKPIELISEPPGDFQKAIKILENEAAI